MGVDSTESKRATKKEQKKQQRKKFEEILAFLIEQFPKAFFEYGKERPLAIGINRSLIERCNTIAGKPFRNNLQLRTAIHVYVKRTPYLQAMKAGVMRVDLDGNDASVVTPEMEEYAQKMLAERQARWESKKQWQAEQKQRRAEYKAYKAAKKEKASMQAAAVSNDKKEMPQQSAEEPIESRRPVISLKKLTTADLTD